jgi:hypothetical protein
MEYYYSATRNKLLINATTWANLQRITSSKRLHTVWIYVQSIPEKAKM